MENSFATGYSYATTFNIHPLDQHMTARMLTYMENYARSKNMDPLLPQTWYTLAVEAIDQFQVLISLSNA